MMEHDTILSILSHMGFDSVWLQWIKAILQSGHSSVLLNGIPGKSFHCKRGVRQGDPLSPLLFIAGAELMQAVVNKEFQEGRLQLPIPCGGYFPIIQYADDTILVMQASNTQVAHLKNILLDYATSTGLKINFQKSSLIPINITNQRAQELADIFGCEIAKMPFTYLGLPMGSTKPTVTDLLPLVDRVERKMTTATLLLSHAGKLAQVNAILTSIAMYTMCTIEIHPKIVEQIDKIRRRCLWTKQTENGEKCLSLAAWDLVCKPKKKGGLGVLNLKTQNQALLLKFLDKFYNHENIQWVSLIWTTYYQNQIPHAADSCGSFWWKSVMKLSPIYRGVATCSIGNGTTTLFWKDDWNSIILQDRFPCLYSFVLEEDISVADFISSEDSLQSFYLPLSNQAYQEWQELQGIIATVQPSNEKDSWVYKWGHKYSAKKFYNFCFQDINPPAPLLWIWKSKLWPKLKFFLWLLMVDRLNTRNMLKRRKFNIGNNFDCPLCDSGQEETLEHLFFKCQFSISCWSQINISCSTGSNRLDIISQAKSSYQGSLFMEFFTIAAWGIWKERNNLIFNGIPPSVNSWRERVKADTILLQFRVPQNLVTYINTFLETF